MFDRLLRFVTIAMRTGHSDTSAREPAGATPSAALAPAQLVDRFDAWEKAARSLAAAQLGDIAAFDAAQRAQDLDAGIGARLRGRTVGSEVALVLGISTTAGASRVAFARTVVDDHPALWRLAADGMLSEWHLRTVTNSTDHLAPGHKQIVAAQLAMDIRARADRGVRELTPHQVGQAAARLAIAIDPDAATQRYELARRHRAVSVTDRHDGTAALWVKGPAECTQHIYDELHRDAITRRHDGDLRSLDAIMFDQVYETLASYRAEVEPGPDADSGAAGGGAADRSPALALLAPTDLDADDPAQDTYADTGTTPAAPIRHLTRRQRRVEAQVVIGATTLLGLDEQPALLRGYGAIPAEIARRIADTSQDDSPSRILLRRLVCDPEDGRLLTMDTRARLYQGPLRDFTIYRDQACRLSGGRIRDIDHITPSTRGGPTTAGNGQALAKNSHVLRDHPKVHVRTGRPPPGLAAEDRLTALRANAPDIDWTLPTGRVHRSEPPSALGHGATPTPLRSIGELSVELALREHHPSR
jgi:hypothetical protein